jgi:hypothetical protein
VNSREKKHVAILEHRRDWLAERTSQAPHLTYDRHELKALNWALRIVKAADEELDLHTLIGVER